ncbi:MAG: hypothetical protein ABWJ42_04880 [Sulfolobales archaeon]
MYVKRRVREPPLIKVILIPFIVYTILVFSGIFLILCLGGYDLRDIVSIFTDINTLASSSVVRYMVVISLLSLALVINTAGGFMNLGAEGQIAIASLGILIASVYNLGTLSAVFLAMVFALIWSLIPYLMKIYYGGSDVLISFIMNFIALFTMNHIVSNVFRGDIARPRSPPITNIDLHYMSGEGYVASLLNRISIESMIALVVSVIFIYILLTKMRIGYSLRMLGYSPRTASLSGVNIPAYMIINLIISSILISLVSLELIVGSDRRVNYNEYARIGIGSVSFGIGYSALSIALLSVGQVFITLIYSYMFAVGYMIVFSLYGFYRLILGTAIVGLSLLSALISELILRYEVKFNWFSK